MRKILIGVVIALTLFSMATVGYAFVNASAYDSGKIPPQVLEVIQPEDGDVVVKVYEMTIGYMFRKYDNDIGKILSELDDYYITYYKITDSEVVGYSPDMDGNYNYVTAFWFPERDDPVIQQWLSGEAIKAVNSDIVVKSAYYLDGGFSLMGAAIYYQTNLGDYVYYNEDNIDCLFALDVFAELQNATYEMRENGQIELGYDEDAIKELDFSPYDYRSADFNPHAPLSKKISPYLIWGCIGGGVLVLTAAAVTTVLIIRKKKKKTEPEEIGETSEET
ncbi:MAG: hypothetical protein E7447_01795 [Ruminococcaceae bacterium]|nr:hypothetical protein [Oscillospiraceae bacterium]